jgi:drug/metabolite transporter (DMT)-like permease
MKETIKAHIALFSANFFYGINYVIAKGIMPNYITARALVFLRIIPSTILFWILCYSLKLEKVEKKDILQLILAGTFGVFINQYCFIQGLDYSSPIDAAIIMTTNPIIVFIMSAIILKEYTSKTKITGVILGALGALILIFGKGFIGFDPKNFKGDWMLIGNSISYAIFLFLTKPLMIKYNALVVLKWMFLVGAILYTPVGIGPFMQINWTVIPPHIIVALFYVIVITTFLCYLLINYSLKTLKSSTVSFYIYTQPVIAAVLASFIGIDKPTLLNTTASLLVFVGVFLVTGMNRHLGDYVRSKFSKDLNG